MEAIKRLQLVAHILRKQKRWLCIKLKSKTNGWAGYGWGCPYSLSCGCQSKNYLFIGRSRDSYTRICSCYYETKNDIGICNPLDIHSYWIFDTD